VVTDALKMLARMAHRGACGCGKENAGCVFCVLWHVSHGTCTVTMTEHQLSPRACVCAGDGAGMLPCRTASSAVLMDAQRPSGCHLWESTQWAAVVLP